MALALTIGALVAGGVYMILRRGMLRVIVGFVLLSHGVNLLLIASGGISRREPAIGDRLDPSRTADPLPQAFVLTAVVIAFAVTVYLLALAVIGDGDDDTDIKLDGRETDRPELIALDKEHPHFRQYAPQNWHHYIDRADDIPDELSAPAGPDEKQEQR